MNSTEAKQFAEDWIASWNAHDLDRILAYYTDDFEMSSPYIVEVMGVASGRLKGKAAIADYWGRALARFPDLHFELIDVLAGADSVAINYYGRGGRRACEVFFFERGRVSRAYAHYGVEAGGAAKAGPFDFGWRIERPDTLSRLAPS